jgi:hypothetical protein
MTTSNKLTSGIYAKGFLKLLNKNYEKLYWSIDKELYDSLSGHPVTIKHKTDDVFGETYTMSAYLPEAKLSECTGTLKKDDLTVMSTYDCLVSLKAWKYQDKSGYKIIVYPKTMVEIDNGKEEEQIALLKKLLW